MNSTELVKNNKADRSELDMSFMLDEKISRLIGYFFDTLLLSLLYLFFGLAFSAYINKYICQSLDTNKETLELFFETTWESTTIILLVFILLFFIPKIPCIIAFPDKNHIKFRHRAEHVVLAFAVVFGHEKLLKKYVYLLGSSS